MALVTSRALVLRSLRLGETSKVVVCYTEEHGKVRLLAKGGRKAGSRFGAALEPFTVSRVVFYLRPGRDLSLVSQAEIERDLSAFRRDAVRMAHGSTLLELVDQLVSGEEPDPQIFAALEHGLGEVERADASRLDGIVWRFALRLARDLGYGPAIDACVLCGLPPGKGARFAPHMGGLACAACLSKHPETTIAGRDASALIVAAVAGDEPPVAVRAVLVDQVWDALLAFLETHTGRPVRLRSLDVLAQFRRTEGGRGPA